MTTVRDRRGRLRAAGGVVQRDGRILLVHRPRYDDWSFPKGKALSRWESDRATALREVLEETGLRCRLGERLPDVTYTDSRGRPKVVRYWRMQPEAGGGAGDREAGDREPGDLESGFRPGDEVDEIRWLTPPEARGLLTYDHDRALLDAMEAALRG